MYQPVTAYGRQSPKQDIASEFSESESSQQILSDEEGTDTIQVSIGEVSDSPILSQDIFSEEKDVTLTNTNPNKMSISVDFLAPQPIQDGAGLSNQWFKEEFELQSLTAALIVLDVHGLKANAQVNGTPCYKASILSLLSSEKLSLMR